jgi:mRNA interferase MazF
MKRGEVWWANLPEPWGRRPVVLVARDEAYSALTWVMVAPVTTNVRDIPTAVALTPGLDEVPRRCAAALDNIQAIHKSWLDARITSLGPERILEIEQALHFALDLSF